MSVIFESTVKTGKDGGWYIELKDTVQEKIEICKDLKEFEQKIQEMGNDYGGRIDEVKWLNQEGLSPAHMQEVRVAMMEYHEKYKDELDQQEEK